MNCPCFINVALSAIALAIAIALYSAFLKKTHCRDDGFIVLKYEIIKLLIGFLQVSCNKAELCCVIILLSFVYKSLSLKLFKKCIVDIVVKMLVKIVNLLFFKNFLIKKFTALPKILCF